MWHKILLFFCHFRTSFKLWHLGDPHNIRDDLYQLGRKFDFICQIRPTTDEHKNTVISIKFYTKNFCFHFYSAYHSLHKMMISRCQIWRTFSTMASWGSYGLWNGLGANLIFKVKNTAANYLCKNTLCRKIDFCPNLCYNIYVRKRRKE